MRLRFPYILIALAILCSLSLLAICVPAVLTQRDLSHPEGIVPWAVQEIATGSPLYSDWREWPHRLMPYGPLLTYPTGIAFRTLGLQEYNFQFYLVGRIQALLYMLATAAVVAAMIPARRYWIAFAFSLASIGLWPGLAIPGVSFRGDWPALFWSLAAAVVAFRKPGSVRTLSFALICFMLSVAYRPALWSFPAACALFLLMQRQIVQTAAWCAAVVVSVSAYMLTGHLLTDGLFTLNQIGASSMGMTTDIYKLALQVLTTPQEFPLITWDLVARMIVAVPVAILIVRKPCTSLERGIGIYYMVALTVNLITLSKAGAGFNYIIEAYMLSTAVLAIGGLRLWHRRAEARAAVNGTAMAAAVLLFALPMVYFSVLNFRTAPQIIAERRISDVHRQLLQLPPTALLGDLAFTHPSPIAHALADPLPYARLARRGKIPAEPLTTRLANHEFSHVVLSPATKYLFFSPNEAPFAGEALQRTYQPQTITPQYEIWVPLDNESTTTAASTPPPPPSE